MKIVLFDIDGTLMKPGGVLEGGSKLEFNSLFSYALNKVFGVDIVPTDYQGKTDSLIFIDTAERAGISREEARRHLPELISISTQYVREKIGATTLEQCDGVADLLNALRSGGYRMGLVTGNIRAIAEMKLTRLGIWDYFEFGGFGDMSETRSKLVDYAIEEAERKLNAKIGRREVVYFGDAPRDVEAGKAAGVVIVSVATGIFGKEQLVPLNPDYLLDNLKDTKAVIKIISGA